ncbi:MAG TPA: Hsp20/alpha crystallin family protein [Bacteroidota bacterium]
MTKNGEVALVRKGNDSLARRMEPLEDYVMPVADIYETADAYVVRVDMPGVSKESISISLEPGQLQIRGLIGQFHNEGSNVLYSEIAKANFYRKFNVGNGIDADAIRASVENGVLTVTLPKNDLTRVREIPIK